MPDETTIPPAPPAPEAPPPGDGHRATVVIEDEMRRSYLDYSMSVSIGRALPDVRDGLKPVHRRILYAMHAEGLHHNKRYSKCAGVVGEVLKKYHPHGDAAVYDALVRLAQDWNLVTDFADYCFVGVELHAYFSPLATGTSHPTYAVWAEVRDTPSGTTTKYHRAYQVEHARIDRVVVECQSERH